MQCTRQCKKRCNIQFIMTQCSIMLTIVVYKSKNPTNLGCEIDIHSKPACCNPALRQSTSIHEICTIQWQCSKQPLTAVGQAHLLSVEPEANRRHMGPRHGYSQVVSSVRLQLLFIGYSTVLSDFTTETDANISQTISHSAQNNDPVLIQPVHFDCCPITNFQ